MRNIWENIRLNLTYDEIDTTIDNLWSVLFTTGYLTQTCRAEKEIYSLKIPNKEIKEVFVLQIQEWFKNIIQKDTRPLQNFCASFLVWKY